MCPIIGCGKETGRNGVGFCNEHYLEWLVSPEYKRLGGQLSWDYLLEQYKSRKVTDYEAEIRRRAQAVINAWRDFSYEPRAD